jgi:hypothetical protein
MEGLVERCAGLDVHKDTVVATIITGTFGKKPVLETKTYGTMTVDLLALNDLADRERMHARCDGKLRRLLETGI